MGDIEIGAAVTAAAPAIPRNDWWNKLGECQEACCLPGNQTSVVPAQDVTGPLTKEVLRACGVCEMPFDVADGCETCAFCKTTRQGDEQPYKDYKVASTILSRPNARAPRKHLPVSTAFAVEVDRRLASQDAQTPAFAVGIVACICLFFLSLFVRSRKNKHAPRPRAPVSFDRYEQRLRSSAAMKVLGHTSP